MHMCYLQCVEVRQPDTVSPAQIPSKVVMADINGLQVPRLIPEEIQHINGLQQQQQKTPHFWGGITFYSNCAFRVETFKLDDEHLCLIGLFIHTDLLIQLHYMSFS